MKNDKKDVKPEVDEVGLIEGELSDADLEDATGGESSHLDRLYQYGRRNLWGHTKGKGDF